MADFTFPGPVNREALAFLERKELTPSFHAADVWPAEHAAAFVSAKTARLDVLETIRGELTAAIEEGKTLRDFQRDLQPQLASKGWWGEKEVVDPETGELSVTRVDARRLRTIYDTNMRQARAAGAWERAQRTKEALPFLEYRLGPSLEHREEHASWLGFMLPVDDPWWDTHMPVNGWGCKCWTRQVSRAEAERRGLEVTDPPPERTRAFRNRRTGEVVRVPRGISPNFAGNPGKTRQSDLGKLLAGKLNEAPMATVNAALRDLAGNEAFESFAKGEIDDGLLPVLRVADSTSAELGLRRLPVATVDQATVIEKNAVTGMSVEDWRFLPEIGASPDRAFAGRDGVWLFKDSPSPKSTSVHGVLLVGDGAGAWKVEETVKVLRRDLELFIKGEQ